MELVNNFKSVITEHYADFKGRASAREFWFFVLAQIIVSVILNVLLRVSSIFVILYIVWVVATFVPNIAVTVRRLHDTDRSGWWYFIALVPCVGFIVLLVFLAQATGTTPNQFGPPTGAASGGYGQPGGWGQAPPPPPGGMTPPPPPPPPPPAV